jgi:hypothetical protein
MEVPLGPHVLLFRGTLRFSCPITWSYPIIIMAYYTKVPLGSRVPLYEDTLGLSCPNRIPRQNRSLSYNRSSFGIEA